MPEKEDGLKVRIYKVTTKKTVNAVFVRAYWSDNQKGVARSAVVKASKSNEFVFPDSAVVEVEWKNVPATTLVVEVCEEGGSVIGSFKFASAHMIAAELSFPLAPDAGSVSLSFAVPDEFLKAEGGVKSLISSIVSGQTVAMAESHVAILQRRLENYPTINALASKAGVSAGWLAAGALVFAFLFIVFGVGANAACNLVGVLYPLYASFKAIKSVEKDDDSQWLTYWIVFSFFSFFEAFTDRLIFWMPFYYFVKFLLLLWCMHPSTRGANQIYVHLIEPFFSRYEARIDKKLAEMGHSGKFAAPDKEQ